MQKQQQHHSESFFASPTFTLVLKILTTLYRMCNFAIDMWFQQFSFSQASISVPIAIGIFAVAEIIVWRKILISEGQKEARPIPTLLIHLWGLLNAILISLTTSIQEIGYHPGFFIICFTQLVNYLITSVSVYIILLNPLIRKAEDFLLVYQPVDNALGYLFIAGYVGSYLDLFAFSDSALSIFYIFTGISFSYAFVNIILSNSLKTLSKMFFVQ